MGYSKVYKDQGGYSVLVAHSSENPVWRGHNVFLTGLLHYCQSGPDEDIEIFDGTDEVFYTVDWKWKGLHWQALGELTDAADGTLEAVAPDKEYYDTIELYAGALGNELVRESLA